MKRHHLFAAVCAAVLTLGLSACGGSAPASTTAAATTAAETTAAATTAAETTAAETTAAEAKAEETTTAETTAAEATEAETTAAEAADRTKVRIGALKGPTTMGIVNLLNKSEAGETANDYEFTMAVQADEVLAKLVGGDLDIALIPANVAAVVNNKGEGCPFPVVDINTLGVLYCVTGDDSIHSVGDLAGKTVISTGQGTTPEYVLRTLTEKSGAKDVTLEFKSEAQEIAAALKADPSQIAVLPQPFVTVAMAQNEALKIAFSLTEAWDELMEDSSMVTGVTVVSRAFLTEHEDAVKTFLAEHQESAEAAVSDLDGTAELIAKYGIIEKAPVAKKALPYCNIVCVTGEEMKQALSGYLEALYTQNPKAVGGQMPGEAFYWIP